MRLKKSSQTSTVHHPFPGNRQTLEGKRAILAVEALAETRLDHSASGMRACGLALTGYRSAAFLEHAHPQDISALARAAANKLLPMVVHLVCGRDDFFAAYDTGHEIYQAFSGSNFFQLFAANVQEALDLPIIAHRVAELLLLPVVCALDRQFTAQAIQTVLMPEPTLLKRFLGLSGDEIDSPTPAQKILYGPRRRRIPRLIDADRPLGIAATLGAESFHKAAAAKHAFIQSHLVRIVDQVMREFGELSGRFYARVGTYQTDDADYLVVARGSIINHLHALADMLRRAKKVKLGVLNLTMLQPFPGDLVSRALKDKKAVTVLEGSDHPLVEDLPLTGEIRSTIHKALENGMAGNNPLPYPEHEVYEKVSRGPALYTGVYNSQNGHPALEELLAAVENMLPGGAQKKYYYSGVRFQQPQLRFPILEALQQSLHKHYPNLADHTLDTGQTRLTLPAETKKHSRMVHKVQIRTAAGLPLKQLGGYLATVIAGKGTRQVNAFQENSSARIFRQSAFTVLFREEEEGSERPFQGSALETTALLVSNPAFLGDLSSLAENAIIIVQSPQSDSELWENLPEMIRTAIRKTHPRMYRVDAREIARESSSIPAHIQEMTLVALTGAYLKVDFGEPDILLGLYRQLLEQEYGSAYHRFKEDFLSALRRGMEEVQRLHWEKLPEFADIAVPEPPAPWTVQQVRETDHTVGDLARFWESVGYFYETGQVDKTIPDPFIASAMIPSRSSVFRDQTPYRSEIPLLIAENCNGCGLCWARCPDSALPATIQDLSTLVETAIARCEQAGAGLIQLKRIAAPLAKQAYQLAANDDLHQYRTLDALMEEAFRRLIEKMGLTEEKLAAVKEEFDRLVKVVEGFPLVRTKRFFDEPHQNQKGSGLLLSIAVDPQACKGCLACVQVCPENALEGVTQSGDIVHAYRSQWQFFHSLPEVPGERVQSFVLDDHPQTVLYQLLNKRAYYSLLGGDPASPGNGTKTAIHLFSAAVETFMQPRIRKFVNQINELRQQLEAKIQGRLEKAVHINDFEAFGQKLSRLKEGELGPAFINDLLKDEQPEKSLDRQQLERLTGLLRRLKRLGYLYSQGANGDGRSRLSLIVQSGEIAIWSTNYPYNPFPYPWVNSSGNDLVSAARGIFEGITQKMAEDFITVRMTELELQDAYHPEEYKSYFHQFGWDDFTPEERALCPPVVVVCDTGSLNGMAAEGLFQLLQSGLPVKTMIINTTAGLEDLERTAAKPQSRRSTAFGQGEQHRVASPGLLALGQGNSFILQSSAGEPGHFLKGALEGLNRNTPALFHIYASDPHQHGIPEDRAAAQEQLAIASRAFPLFRYTPDTSLSFRERLELEGNNDSSDDWSFREIQVDEGREVPAVWSLPITPADWAIGEGRFRNEFIPLAKREWNDNQVPLADYLKLTAEEREGKSAFIHYPNPEKKPLRIMVSPRMVVATEKILARWRLLQELAGLNSPESLVKAAELERRIGEKLQHQQQEIEQEYTAKLDEVDRKHWENYHQRLTRKLLTLCGVSPGESLFKKPLREYRPSNDEVPPGQKDP